MDLKQSWIVSCARGQMSLYEIRIVVKIIEYANERMRNKFITKSTGRLYENCEDVKVSIPIRYILTEGSNHYEDVEEGAKRLCQRTMEFLSSKSQTWYCSSIINNVVHERKKGMITFNIYGGFLDAVYDFTHGFSRYDLQTAMQFKLPSSVRMFMLMYAQKVPQTYSVAWLKETFGVADKYKQTRDFIKKVIEPAINEINEKSAITIEYERIKTGNAVRNIKLVTKRKATAIEENISDIKKNIDEMLGKEMIMYLVTEVGFTYRELSYHEELLKRLAEHTCALDIIYGIVRRMRKYGRGKGYVIAALRSELRQ